MLQQTYQFIQGPILVYTLNQTLLTKSQQVKVTNPNSNTQKLFSDLPLRGLPLAMLWQQDDKTIGAHSVCHIMAARCHAMGIGYSTA